MAERRIDLYDLDATTRELAAEAEITGNRTLFLRNERPVALILSFDEYLALKETVQLGNRADLREDLQAAEEELRRGALLLPEDLFVE